MHAAAPQVQRVAAQTATFQLLASILAPFVVIHTSVDVAKKALAAANKAVDGEYRKRIGNEWIRPREAYMTQVYNYFAYPATVAKFCDAALIMARESMLVKPTELQSFAERNLAFLDGVFNQFFLTYEQYLADAAAWDQKYAPKAVTAPVILPDAAAAPAAAPAPVTSPEPATVTTPR